MLDQPAFPSHGSMGEVAHQGMTLRDYFAGQALHGFSVIQDPQEAAAAAYGFADAMMAYRIDTTCAPMPFHGWDDLQEVEHQISGWIVCTKTLQMDTGAIKAVEGYMFPARKSKLGAWMFYNTSKTWHTGSDSWFEQYFRQATSAEYDAAVQAGRISRKQPDTQPAADLLPERWAIQRTSENAEMVNAWANSDGSGYIGKSGYMHSHKDHQGLYHANEMRSNHTLITDDQFKRLVLKQS